MLLHVSTFFDRDILQKNVLVVLLVLVLISFAGCSLDSADTSYTQHKYYAVVKEKCGVCHNMARVLSRRYSPEKWQETIERMRSKDEALISDEEAEKINSFLVEVRSSR